MTSPVLPPEENALEIVSSAALSRDGSMFFETALDLKGINDVSFRGALVKQTPEERVKTFERVLKSVVAGAELIKCEIRPADLRDTSVPLSVKLAARFPEMVIRGVTRDELTVPTVSRTLGMVNWLLEGKTSLEKRKYTLKIRTTARVRERLTVDLGGALGDVLDLPPAETTANGYDYVRTFTVTNGTLRMDRSLTIGAVEFEPEAYQRLREEIKRVEAAERRKPVFAVDGTQDANVRWIDVVAETDIRSEKAWRTIHSCVKEVLTYEGKKSSAELEIPYNPAVETVEFLSATVSNRNGKVHSVSDKEMNVMDCAWASAAPRYPAGKLLIVNLPSVEIGSVIAYRYARTVTNAPATFYGAYAFDSSEPLERKVVRVNGWRREVVRPRRIPKEPNQPSASLWRDQVIISSNRFETLDLAIPSVISSLVPHPSSLREIRDWMAKDVKLAGPSLYELPLGLQLTDPETVLKERYATRLDYIRTMCALLRGAGYEADVVFAADDADEPQEIRNRIRFEKPNVRAFSAAL